jgi:hypothetical protein
MSSLIPGSTYNRYANRVVAATLLVWLLNTFKLNPSQLKEHRQVLDTHKTYGLQAALLSLRLLPCS